MASHRLFPSILPGAKETDEDTGELEEADAGEEELPEESSEEEETEGEALITTEEVLDRGDCPWCDEYGGENPAQHAAAKHPEEWAAYKEARETGET